MVLLFYACTNLIDSDWTVSSHEDCSAVNSRSAAWIWKTSHLGRILRYQARKTTSPRSDTTCSSNASEQSSYFDSRVDKNTDQIVLTNSTIDCRSIDEIGRFLRAQYRTHCLAMAFVRCSQRIFRSQSYLSSTTELNSTQYNPKNYSSQKLFSQRSNRSRLHIRGTGS